MDFFQSSTCSSDSEKDFEELDSGKAVLVLEGSLRRYTDNRLGTAYEYLSQREVGGNMATIHFGHAIDFVQNGQFSILHLQAALV